jgi:hypothetical protein
MKGSSELVISNIPTVIDYGNRNEQHVDEMVATKLQELWYTGKGEVAINALDETSQWHEEAVAVAKWINDCYAYLVEHRNAEDFDTFINNMPNLIQ